MTGSISEASEDDFLFESPCVRKSSVIKNDSSAPRRDASKSEPRPESPSTFAALHEHAGSSTREGSVPSAISFQSMDSSGKTEAREAGYAVSPLHIKKDSSCNAGLEDEDDPLCEKDIACNHLVMQDLIEVINMDAAEIRKARRERVTDAVEQHIENEKVKYDSPTRRKKSLSFRSDTTRASSSIREFLKSGSTPIQAHVIREDEDEACFSTATSSTKPSVRSGLGRTLLTSASGLSSGTGSLSSSADGDRPQTARSKKSGGRSLFTKLKSKASFDALKRRKSMVRGGYGNKANAEAIVIQYGDGNANLEGATDPGHMIPPLPKAPRLTLTVENEDTRHQLHLGAAESDVKAQEQQAQSGGRYGRDEHRQMALDKLRGEDSHLLAVPEDKTFVSAILKKMRSRERIHGGGKVQPLEEARACGHLKPKILWPLVTEKSSNGVFCARNEAEDRSGHCVEQLSRPIAAELVPEPMSSPSRTSLITVEDFLLGSRSPRPPVPKLPPGLENLGPPKIPPRIRSRQSPQKTRVETPSRTTNDSPYKDKPRTEKRKSLERLPRLMKKPTYGSMPRGYGTGGPSYRAIDISRYATASPIEALSSEATVMSLAPKASGSQEVQDKSKALADVLPRLNQRPCAAATGRMSPVKKLRNVASAGMLGHDVSGEVEAQQGRRLRAALRTKRSLGTALRENED